MHSPARNSRHAWLAAVLPESASRVRVDDPELAATLASAGAELVGGAHADVEIISDADLGVTADHLIVTIDHGPRGAPRNDDEPLPTRSAGRVRAAAAARLDARRARSALARSGFRTRSYVWDFEQPLRARGEGPRVRTRERFPRAALVVGARGQLPRTTLEAILAEAAAVSPPPIDAAWSLPRVQESRLVVLGEEGALRVSIGPGARTIAAQERTLHDLRSRPLSPGLAGRLPAILASRTTGLARWTLEERLPGRQPGPPLTHGLLEQALELLVELHALGGGEPRDLRAAAGVIAGASAPEQAQAVGLLGERLRERLADVRRGFAHGDFWRGNLLVDDGRLSGVIDWEDASAGQLPLLDLLHLELTADQSFPSERWGPAIIDRLLPAARSGGSERVRAYCARVGLRADPSLLVDLTFAYWLERVALELGSFTDRRLRRLWMEQNVIRVLQAAAAIGL